MKPKAFAKVINSLKNQPLASKELKPQVLETIFKVLPIYPKKRLSS